MPAEVEEPDRIEASQAGNGPLSDTRDGGHRPGGRLHAISADEYSQVPAVQFPVRHPGPRPLLPGAALNAVDPSVRLALLFR
jgi:hypothetical protein